MIEDNRSVFREEIEELDICILELIKIWENGDMQNVTTWNIERNFCKAFKILNDIIEIIPLELGEESLPILKFKDVSSDKIDELLGAIEWAYNQVFYYRKDAEIIPIKQLWEKKE